MQKGTVQGLGTGTATVLLASGVTVNATVLGNAPAQGSVVWCDEASEASWVVSGGTGTGDWDTGDYCFSARTSKTGWLLCDNSSQLRTTYSALFGIIGTNFGFADSSHFNLPPNSRVLSGAGGAHALHALYGNETHNITAAESGLPYSFDNLTRPASGGIGYLRNIFGSGQSGASALNMNQLTIAANLFIKY